MHTLDHEPSDRVEAPARFAPGTTIGHFRIVRQLGAGGMGVVFEAQDADLDRRVAIKVVRDRGAGSVAGLRLIREAQAMARLTHPNVVMVHEVGTVEVGAPGDAQVFVVMELVVGTTLAEWLALPRPWRAIVDAFLAAAQGLLAAHHAGLVHRDFKPSNVLVDATGRVRVSDFGLAHGDDQLAGGQLTGGQLAGGSEPAGTLAYMAPEQRAGRPVDARADQYAFAIALQEALSARRAIGKVPRRIRIAITRALAIDPEDRFPTLAELAVELRAPLHSRRRAAAFALGGAAIAGLAAFTWLDNARGAEVSCADGAALVDRVWGPAARAGQLARFLARDPHAGIAIDSSLVLVDDWAQAWKLGRRAACAAGEPQRSARLGCLDRDLHELRGQLAVWAQPDQTIAENALRAAAALPRVDACAAAIHDDAIGPLVLDKITRIDALVRSGRAPAAVAELDPLLAVAATTGNPRDLAAALLGAGKAELETGAFQPAHDHFARAAQEAGRATDDALLVEAFVYEAKTTSELGHPNDALGLLDAAQAITLRGTTPATDQIAITRGDALHDAGKLREASDVLRPVVSALEARASRDPRERIALSVALGQLAAVLLDAEDFPGARDLYRRCVALDEASFGPEHPEVAKSLADLATTEIHLEQLADARTHLDRAQHVLAVAYGGRGVLAGKLELVRAKLEAYADHGDAAIAAYQAAGRAFTGVLAPDHPLFATVEEGLAERLRAADKCGEALPHIERALQLLERARLDAKHHALELTELGSCLADVDRLAEAESALRRALSEMDDEHMTKRWYAEPKAVLAEIAIAQHHQPAALALYRDALAATDGDPSSEIAALRAQITERIAELAR